MCKNSPRLFFIYFQLFTHSIVCFCLLQIQWSRGSTSFVCVCVWERERERDRQREGRRSRRRGRRRRRRRRRRKQHCLTIFIFMHKFVERIIRIHNHRNRLRYYTDKCVYCVWSFDSINNNSKHSVTGYVPSQNAK